MAFRQECCAGQLVGFFVVAVGEPAPAPSSSSSSSSASTSTSAANLTIATSTAPLAAAPPSPTTTSSTTTKPPTAHAPKRHPLALRPAQYTKHWSTLHNFDYALPALARLASAVERWSDGVERAVRGTCEGEGEDGEGEGTGRERTGREGEGREGAGEGEGEGEGAAAGQGAQAEDKERAWRARYEREVARELSVDNPPLPSSVAGAVVGQASGVAGEKRPAEGASGAAAGGGGGAAGSGPGAGAGAGARAGEAPKVNVLAPRKKKKKVEGAAESERCSGSSCGRRTACGWARPSGSTGLAASRARDVRREGPAFRARLVPLFVRESRSGLSRLRHGRLASADVVAASRSTTGRSLARRRQGSRDSLSPRPAARSPAQAGAHHLCALAEPDALAKQGLGALARAVETTPLAMAQHSVEVGPPVPAGQSKPRRYHKTADKLYTAPNSETRVLADVLARTIRQKPDGLALGWRDTIKVHTEMRDVKKVVDGDEVTEKKQWTTYELSDYRYQTYAELGTLVEQVAAGLVKTGHSSSTIFNIYGSTSAHWLTIANACARQGITFATAYDSLGQEGLRHSIQEPEVYGLFTNAPLLGTLAAVVADTPSLKVLVWDGKPDDVPAGALDKIRNAGVDVHSWDDLVALGAANPVAPSLPQPEDVACLMYTSGSTGAPKAVEITNQQVVAVIGGVLELVQAFITPDARFIAYLPLSHIFELAVEFTLLSVGILIGYSSPKTLSDTNMRAPCVGDMRALSPTIMCGVPTVWETIRKGLLAKVEAGGRVRSSLFHGAVAAKKYTHGIPLVGGLVRGVTDAVVFSKVKQATGGKLRYAVNGGAGVSRDTQEFLMRCLTPTFIQGWGLTETTALPGGEYIALERLESIYKSCALVLNICVYATSSASKPMAIVVPAEPALRSYLSSASTPGLPAKDADWSTICSSKEVRKAVLAEMNATGKKAGLKPLETLQTVLLADEEWTPQNGYTSAAQKLNRKNILHKFEGDIKKVYP
ncbi:uncharacterized protein RHOBADRAFT_50177 [Rhodotorula graminis WP1]|uniref:AMP-dependent synthetase/ligase domain-containing protein n=1 Tax=Rhodotorula graminis (strain WP1) TaxID=578459 RepID=A0A0P9EVK5_RHOGW|nr:uncharacterized protein RHOBADRAFT_50177 [Rhodotorula graminis WP1]KPV73188.1 hypothetical protein RHOBADRAFT_50177 [Rhodotorula graminis WP1]